VITVTDLPLVNAILNGTSTTLLLLGYSFIRRKNQKVHKIFMISALATSTLFLISYLVYHYNVGSVSFKGHGSIRTLYFAILISHSVLAAAVPPLALVTLVRALRRRFEKHKTIARLTLPIWLYVSITGVTIYLMLYQL
jgi:uncharacterized membrane protein YozB (DUF420 family)